MPRRELSEEQAEELAEERAYEREHGEVDEQSVLDRADREAGW